MALALGLALPKLAPAVGSSLSRSPDRPSYVPAFELKEGRQIALVYVGKAACAWSNREEMPPAVESIKLSLLRQARERNASFAVIGIAPDWAPERGIAHLSKFGRFDEIATGSSWSNTLLGTLEGIAGRVSTPTVLVLERTVEVRGGEASAGVREISNQRLLAKKIGVFEIRKWARGGAVLPDFQDVDDTGTDRARARPARPSPEEAP